MTKKVGRVLTQSIKMLIKPFSLVGKALKKIIYLAKLIQAREQKRSQVGANAAKKAAALSELERQKEQQRLERGSIPSEKLIKPRTTRTEKLRNNQTR